MRGEGGGEIKTVEERGKENKISEDKEKMLEKLTGAKNQREQGWKRHRLPERVLEKSKQ